MRVNDNVRPAKMALKTRKLLGVTTVKEEKRKRLGAAGLPIGWRTAGRELDNRLLQSLALSPVPRGSLQRSN